MVCDGTFVLVLADLGLGGGGHGHPAQGQAEGVVVLLLRDQGAVLRVGDGERIEVYRLAAVVRFLRAQARYAEIIFSNLYICGPPKPRKTKP